MVICQTALLRTSHLLHTELSLGMSWGSRYVRGSSCYLNAPLLSTVMSIKQVHLARMVNVKLSLCLT